jgi:hypothetical protein
MSIANLTAGCSIPHLSCHPRKSCETIPGLASLDLFGHPATDALRVTERFRRRDFGYMDLEITMTDAKAYTKPWRIELHPHLLPDNELLEWICLEGNRGMEHMVGK